MNLKKAIIIVIIIVITIIIGYTIINKQKTLPEQVVKDYFSKINEQKYEEMYQMLSDESKQKISQEDFITRNQNIYQGIDMSNMQIEIRSKEKSGDIESISYETKMNTSGGEISFNNNIMLTKDKGNQYKIQWSSNLIFPELNDTDKVRIKTEEAKRGEIIDRNGIAIAANAKASSVGIVPGKLSENKEQDIQKIAQLLQVTQETINSKLQATWVKEDSFVPIKTISMDETELKNNLLQISGVKINSVDARTYILGEAAAHLTGYVQTITKEELEKNPDYTSSSIIGKAGLEKQYENKLKGKDGIEIYIVDEQGNKKGTITKQEKIDGENLKITIDSGLQQELYNELANDEGLFVVMNPKTGEILALVSTPSYNVNKMTLGMSSSEWQEISNNENTPMLARYLQTYCPGSTFKPITGAIGLTSNSLSVDDIFSYSGLSWQKDSSWGTYNITTLTKYNGQKNLKNALIHSDNIYFAQAALQIGAKNLVEGLNKIKFNENIEFELNLSKSQYSNNNNLDQETLLADTGYGQGQILVNPIHMASIYSAFYNNGNMVKPYLEYKEEKEVEYLVENAFTEEAANEIKKDLIEVVENPEGTANDMKIEGTTIAGKTGTAELKTKKGESSDTIGWFNCFSVDTNNPYLVIGMVEKANNNGGSHYLIPKIKKIIKF